MSGFRSLRARASPPPTVRDEHNTPGRIVLGVTSDTSMILLRGAPEYLRDHGWDVHVVCSPGPNSRRMAQAESGITVHNIPMQRDLWPLRDIAALVQWILLLFRVRPDVVSSGTPKAGLLGMLAARATSVPFRVYVLRGLRFETVEGMRRPVLRAAEVVAARCSHVVQAVSFSLREAAIEHKVAPRDKVVVIGAGSSNGVLIPDRPLTPRPTPERGNLTVGYVGRVTEDKGVDLLLAAIEELAARGIPGTLLIIGGVEGRQTGDLLDSFAAPGWEIERHGHVDDVAPYYERMTLLVLPTRREGFPNVVLEAAAHGVPCVATHATGVPDAIVPGVTGEIVDQRDPALLASAIEEVGLEPGRAATLGSASRERAEQLFSRHIVHRQLESFYRDGAVAMNQTHHTSDPRWEQ